MAFLKLIPAKIIEPLTGASACALANHKWTINIGISTKKSQNHSQI